MQIAEALLLSDDTIRQHVKEYKASQKLKPERSGSIEKITPEQSRLLVEHLQTYTYLYVNDIIAYIKSVYKVPYSVSGMRCWLKRNEFSYKKPVLVPGKVNEAQQKKINSDQSVLQFPIFEFSCVHY
jgi:transposase